MSLNLAYVQRSVDAAFDLVVRDERAWSKFDLTADGFFRSFAALLIVLPLNVATDLIANQVAINEKLRNGQSILEQTYGLGDAIFSTIAMTGQLLVFPIAMVFLLRFLELTHRYSALIIAHNWGTVVVYLFNLPAFLLHAAGIISADLAIDLNLIVFGLTLYYRFYIAQTALDAGWSMAAGIATLDIVLQLYFLIALNAVSGLWLPTAS